MPRMHHWPRLIIFVLCLSVKLSVIESRGVAILGHGGQQTKYTNTYTRGGIDDELIPWWGWVFIVFTVVALLILILTRCWFLAKRRRENMSKEENSQVQPSETLCEDEEKEINGSAKLQDDVILYPIQPTNLWISDQNTETTNYSLP